MTRNVSPFAVNTYSYTLSHTARACLESLMSRGYTEFELMMYPGHLWPADTDSAARRELRRFIESNGLVVTTLNMPNVDLNLAGAAAEMREYTLAILKGIIELAGDLGAPGVVIGPGKANPLFPMPTEQLMGHFYKALDLLEPLASKYSTALYVENMPFAFLPGIDALMQALDQYGNDRIGVVYDIANGHFVNENIGAALRRCQSRVRIVHLSDTSQQIYKHDAVGLGTIDFGSIPGYLTQIGYAKKPILEIVAPNADKAIDDSASRLIAMGWGKGAH